MPDTHADNDAFGASKGPKKTRRAFNVEEIFASVSTIQASDLVTPPTRVTLTPRSAEACLKHGINPECLRIRDLDSFWETSIDPAIQRMRHEAYSQRRHEMMRLCRSERKRLINLEMRAHEEAQGIGGAVPSASSAAERILAEQAKLSVAAVELEKKRLEKMKLKQQKEIEQVVAFEQKMAELQFDINRKMEAERRKQEAVQRAREKRLREAAEERRMKELRKKAQEDAEEEERQRVAREMFVKDRQLQEEKEAEERRQRLDAQRKEEERIRKAEEHRLATQKILAEQQMLIQRKMEEMAEIEQARIAKVRAKQREDRRKMRERRKYIEDRLAANLEMAKLTEGKRKEDFLTKTEHHEALRGQFLAEQKQQQDLYHEQQQLLEKKRQLILRQFKEEEEARKRQLQQRFKEDEDNVRKVYKAREREHMLQRERQHLKQIMKLENVERVKRIKEYKRLEIMKKIHDAQERMEFMFQQKQDIIAQRKKTAVVTKRQKDELMKLVEKAKTCTGDKAVETLKKAINAQLTIREGGEGKHLKRARSAGQLSHRQEEASPQHNASSSALPSLPRSKSAQENTIGPPPEGAGLLGRRAQQSEGVVPEAYVSPYEVPPSQKASDAPLPTTVTF